MRLAHSLTKFKNNEYFTMHKTDLYTFAFLTY